MLSCHIHLFYNNQYGALLCFYVAGGAYEYIEYNYGFLMLLTLYSVGTIVSDSITNVLDSAKGNSLITL